MSNYFEKVSINTMAVRKGFYQIFALMLQCSVRIWDKLGITSSYQGSSSSKRFLSKSRSKKKHHNQDGDSKILGEFMQSNGNCSTGMAPEMRDKAYSICRDFLSGEWKRISSSDMVFKTVSGGFSNYLFYCSLPSTHTPLNGEPSQVLLRMYGQIHDSSESKITDSVITMLLSERKLGPKLYGIFPGGRLEEYLPARAMTCQELKNPQFSATIACKLANVHSLDMPINKEPSWLFETMERWNQYIHTNMTGDLNLPNSVKSIASELLAFDFDTELKWLNQFLSQCQSPSVFSHNDLQEGNILLPDTTPANLKMYPLDDRIVFIDFEYCAYNYRGFDIGNHFCERMFDYNNEQWPHYHALMDEYPNDTAKRYFIREYLKQWKKCDRYDEVTEDHLIKEADYFALASHMIWTLWAITMSHTSTIQFGYWEYAKTRLSAYFKHKEFLLSKKSK